MLTFGYLSCIRGALPSLFLYLLDRPLYHHLIAWVCVQWFAGDGLVLVCFCASCHTVRMRLGINGGLACRTGATASSQLLAGAGLFSLVCQPVAAALCGGLCHARSRLAAMHTIVQPLVQGVCCRSCGCCAGFGYASRQHDRYSFSSVTCETELQYEVQLVTF